MKHRYTFCSILLLSILYFSSVPNTAHAQMELGQIVHSDANDCDGRIEVIANGSDAPYTISFGGGGADYLIEGVDGRLLLMSFALGLMIL